MYKLCFLLACLARASDGRRLKADVMGRKLTEQLNLNAVSGSHGQANRSGRGQFASSMADPKKVLPILLTFFSPVVVFAPDTNALSFGSSIGILSNPIGANAILSNPIGAHAGLEEVLPPVWGPTVRIVVSVNWEGLDLHKDNLRFFKDFREAHPEVPLTHFLNAAYFTKSEGQSIQEWSPHQALSPIDETGLYIQGLKSLVESSGVEYRSEPNILQSPEALAKALEDEKKDEAFGEALEKALESMEMASSESNSSLAAEWKTTSERIHKQNYLRRDVGYDTDIRAYSVDELQAIISKSKRILKKQGLKVGKSFRVGGWLAGPHVLEAFRREGFRVNSSAVGLEELIGKLPAAEKALWKEIPLVAMLRELWPGITKESQPFLLETPVGWVLEMPHAGGSADYTTVKEMVDHIDSAFQQLDYSDDRFAHIGFHQETAATYGPRVIAAITDIKRKHGHRVVFETLQASARRARSTQRFKELEAKI